MSSDDSLNPDLPDLPEKDPNKHFLPDKKNKFESIFEKVETMALRQGSGIDLNTFSSEQRDKLLSIVEKNEDHAFEYFKEDLASRKEIKLARIKAGNFTFKTNRIVVVIAIVAIVGLTLVVLIYKPDFFFQWLSFLTGLIGGGGLGYGYGKSSKSRDSKED